MMATTNPCTTCGACCAFSNDWPRFTLETEAEIELIPAAFVNETGMKCVGGRCSALQGEVGGSTSCGIYEVRPQVCRVCEPGDAECLLARDKYGLGPLLLADVSRGSES